MGAKSFKVNGNVVIRDDITYKSEVVMTKEIFQECYEKWIKEEKSDLISRQELIDYIDKSIEATNTNDSYSVGMRNGMRFVKSLITDGRPEYE